MMHSAYDPHTTPWLPARQTADVPGDSLVVLPGRDGAAFGLGAGEIARGVYLVGASRSGKTTVLCHCLAQLIPRLGPHDGLLVFDPRQDFRRRFCRPGDVVLDPDPQGCGNGTWSLFADLVAFGTSDYALEQNAARIAARLFRGRENQMNPFFTTAPRRLLENLLLVYAREILAHPGQAARYGNHTLLQFCAGLSRQRLEELIRRSPAPGELRSYLGDGSTEQALGVLGEFQAAVTPLHGFTGQGAPRFSAVDFARNGGGRVCYLQYDASAHSSLDAVYGLIVDLALSTALSARPQPGRLYLVLDELPLIGGSVESLQRALNFGAGQHIGGIFCAAQSNAQLREQYGADTADSILAGFGTTIVMRPGDAATRRFAQERCGQITVPLQMARCGVVTTSLQQLPALPDGQLLSMGPGDAVVLAPPAPPFAFHFQPFAG